MYKRIYSIAPHRKERVVFGNWEKISAKDFTSKWGPPSRSYRSPVAEWPSKRLVSLKWVCAYDLAERYSTLQSVKLEQRTHLAWTLAPRTVSKHTGDVSSHWDCSHLCAARRADTCGIAVGDFLFWHLMIKDLKWWLLDQPEHEELGSMKNPTCPDWPVGKM